MKRQIVSTLLALSSVTMISVSATKADDLFGAADTGRALWQGAYIGAHTGAGLGTAGGLSTGGTVIGLHGGYNFQAGQIVGGGEVDATSSQIKNSASGETFTQKWMTSGRMRGGFVYGNLMTYGTFGMVASATNYTNTYSTDVSKVGWVYGGGVEAMVMPHVVLRGELLRYDMGSASYLNSAAQSVSLDTQSNVFRFGVSYKF
jgi:hypothetical protein